MEFENDQNHRLRVEATTDNELVIRLSRQAACDLGWDALDDLQVTVVGLNGAPSQRALVLHTSRNVQLAIYRHKASMIKHAGLRSQ